MAKPIIMPKLGMAMKEGEISKWLCSNGESVESGQPIVQVMSKKITYQVPAPHDGTLFQLAPIKAKAPVGAVLGYVLDAGEKPPQDITADFTVERADSTSPPVSAPAASKESAERKSDTSILATPAAKRLARDKGVNLAEISGSGPAGRIQEQDVQAYIDAGSKRETSTESLAPERTTMSIPFEGMRAAIAEHMVRSQHEMAQVTLSTESDVGELLAIQKEVGHQTEVSLTALLSVLTVAALKRHPRLNASLVGDRIQLLADINLGVAVALDEGLIVPVIRNAHRLDVFALDRELTRLANAARQGSLSVDEVTGSTFTVTNLGMYGIDVFTPIVNSPECAILGVGRINEKPAVWGGAIIARPHMILSLTFDHRLIDGAPAAQFLQTLSQFIRHPGLAFVYQEGERL